MVNSGQKYSTNTGTCNSDIIDTDYDDEDVMSDPNT